MQTKKKPLFTKQKQNLQKNQKRNKSLQAERSLYSLSGLLSKDIITNDLFLDSKNYIHYTIIKKSKKTDKNQLLMVHGYGGMGAIYYKLIKYLADHFYMVLIDIPGMGFNYRDKKLKDFKLSEEWLGYYLEKIEDFVNRIGFVKFNLLGHSLGSFITGHYFDKHKDKILKLFMLSPAGFNEFTEQHLVESKQKIEKLGFFKRKMIFHFADKIFEDKKSPFEYIYFPFKNMFLNKYLSNKRFDYSEQEKNNLKIIYSYFISLPQYSERCLGYFLNYGIKSNNPLINVIKNKKNDKRLKDIAIYYGTTDWMDSDDTHKNLRECKIESLKCYLVTDSGHQMVVQNTEDLGFKILDFYYK